LPAAVRITILRGETALAERFCKELLSNPNIEVEDERMGRFLMAQILLLLGRRAEAENTGSGPRICAKLGAIAILRRLSSTGCLRSTSMREKAMRRY